MKHGRGRQYFDGMATMAACNYVLIYSARDDNAMHLFALRRRDQGDLFGSCAEIDFGRRR